MSRNRNKKARYRLAMQTLNGEPAAVLEIDDDDDREDLAGFEKSLAKGLDAPAAVEPGDQVLFIPITKVDAQRREVWGRAAQEVGDHAGEILDYASSKPLFEAWVNETWQRSGGKSKGNIRAMHQPIAAGKVIDFAAVDSEKAFDIGTKIVDDNEWQKVLEGVYSGFSIGGRYARRWADRASGLTRYTAEPREISLVDTPAIPTATFKLVKEDGSEELRKFATAAPTRETVNGTPLLMQQEPHTTIELTAADQADPQPDSERLIEAQNPGEAPIDPPQPAIVNPQPEAEALYTSSGIPHAKLDQPADFEKAVQDIPGLRHVTRGMVEPGVFDVRSCGNCLHYRFMGDTCYCRKFDSMVRPDWVCNDWTETSGDADSKLIPLAETAPLAKPDDHLSLAEPAGEVDKAAQPAEQKDQAETQLAARGARVGIARRDGEPLTPPKGYPTDPAAYADPANWSWPCDKSRAATAVGYYNGGKGKNKYSPREWAVLGRRIARLAGAALNTRYKFDPTEKQISRIPTEAKKMEKTDVGSMLTQMRGLLDSDEPDARDQAKALLDVAIDTVSTPSAINPQTQAPATSLPTAVKAEEPPSESTSDSKAPEASVPPTSTPAPKAEAKKIEEPAADEIKKEGVNMPDNVFATQPPAQFNIGAGGDSFIKTRLPEFMEIMTRGDDVNRLDKAFKRVADGDQMAFTDLYNAACFELAKMAGFTSQNLEAGTFPRRTIFGAGVSGYGPEVNLAKAFNATTAPGVYLQRLLALMLPVLNPWRQRVNTTNPETGSDKAIWRAVLGFQSTVLAMAMRSAEAGTTIGSTTGNGIPINEDPTTFTASYQSIKANGVVTYKSLYTMRGYDDPVSAMLLEVLTAILRVEEMQNVIGNYAAVAKPTSVTATASTAAGALPAATYTVYVTSLTGQGWRLTQEIPSYLGSGTYTINGTSQATVGESDAASGSDTLGATGQMVVSWPAVAGAAAYNVYIGNGTTVRFHSTVTAPKITITTYPSAGNTAIGITDTTANSLGFEGVMPWSALSTVYSQTIPNKSSVLVNAAGSGLTLVSPNGIAELDTVFESLYRLWNIAPSLLLMSSKTAKHLTKIVGSSSNAGQTIFISQGAAQGQIVGGVYANSYINSFAQYLQNAPATVPVLAHPYYPDGQIAVLCENIPYPNSRRARAWELSTLRPYTYTPLANLTDHIPFMIAADELLQNHHPSAQGCIYGIDVS